MVTNVMVEADKRELAEQRRVRLLEISKQIKALDATKYQLLSEVLNHDLWRGSFHSFECYRQRHHVSSAQLREMAENGEVE